MPGYQQSLDTTTDTLLRRLSAKEGNPFGNPGGLTEAMNYINGNLALPTLDNYRRVNAGAGGLAALTSAAPGAATSGIDANANLSNAIGAGAADIFNPPKSLSDILREAKIGKA